MHTLGEKGRRGFHMSSSRPSSRRRKLDSQSRRPRWRNRHKFDLSFQNLEKRWLMATFQVVNTNDSGAGSLRQAILDSNTAGGSNTIQFSIGTQGSSQTISPPSTPPAGTPTLLIDGCGP